jgi:hypothetical protein
MPPLGREGLLDQQYGLDKDKGESPGAASQDTIGVHSGGDASIYRNLLVNVGINEHGP